MNTETVVGVIGRPHGVRGEVAVEVRTDEPERRFAPGQVLRDESGTRPFTVQSVRDHSGRLLVRFAEVVNRETAEAVRGTLLIAAVEPEERPLEPEVRASLSRVPRFGPQGAPPPGRSARPRERRPAGGRDGQRPAANPLRHSTGTSH